MYLLHDNGLVQDGNNPTLLNGYGGFNVADLPYFSVSRLLFVRQFRGLVACANLRGGRYKFSRQPVFLLPVGSEMSFVELRPITKEKNVTRDRANFGNVERTVSKDFEDV